MSRVQLALNVSDLDAAIAFYSRLFASSPAKVRPGYANFVVGDPPLKLVLIETSQKRGTGVGGALNHLGIEVETPHAVADASARLSSQGLSTTEEHETTCCYALQEKAWVEDPDGLAWEVYAVLADAAPDVGSCGDEAGICCRLQSEAAPAPTACC